MKKIIGNTKGTTMVNVLVAFFIMVIMVLLFSQVVSFTHKILNKSDEIRQETSSVIAEYATGQTDTHQEYQGEFKLEDAKGHSFTLRSSINSYKSGNITLYSFGMRNNSQGL